MTSSEPNYILISHFQTPPLGGLGLEHMNLRGHKHLVNNTMTIASQRYYSKSFSSLLLMAEDPFHSRCSSDVLIW
jgi:hypothetical protein